jgi:hypothetical protein
MDDSPGAVLWSNDQQGHPVEVTRKFTINYNELIDGVIFSAQLIDNPGTYILGEKNCTSVAIEAAKVSDVELPETIGVWPLNSGSSVNPGDLGQDLRLYNIPPKN